MKKYMWPDLRKPASYAHKSFSTFLHKSICNEKKNVCDKFCYDRITDEVITIDFIFTTFWTKCSKASFYAFRILRVKQITNDRWTNGETNWHEYFAYRTITCDHVQFEDTLKQSREETWESI